MPSPETYDKLFDDDRNAAVGSVAAVTPEQSPDEAVRALELGRVSGVDPSSIYGVTAEFEHQHRALLNSDLVASNKHLQDYLNSHPLASKLSYDDIGPLDKASEALSKLNPTYALAGAGSAAAKFLTAGLPEGYEAFAHGFSGQPLEGLVGSNFETDYPISANLMYPLAAPVRLPAAVFSGIAAMVKARIHAGGEAFNINTTALENDVAALIETEAMGMTGRHAIPAPTQRAIVRRAVEVAMPYLKEGKDGPPPGVNLWWDSMRKAEASDNARKLDDAVKATAQTATNERNAAFYGENFAKRITGDATLAIDAEAIQRLYGSAKIEPDDNKLGGLITQQQLESALASGGKVEVPSWQFISHVAQDPELYKELKDDILVTKHGFTVNEAAEQGEAKAPKAQEPEAPAKPAEGEAEGPVNLDPNPGSTTLPGPVQLVRGAAGHEPMAAVGDRKLTLEKQPTVATGGVIPSDKFHLLNQEGEKVGSITATPYDGGKRVYIDLISGLRSKGYHPNSFGPALMRSLILQLKQAYPNLEQIGGFRVTGAREKAGAVGTRDTWVKADEMDPGTYRSVRDILSQWHQVYEGGGQDVHALFGDAPTSPLGQIVTDVIKSMAPEGTRVMATEGLTVAGDPVHGVFTPGRVKQILVAMANNEDPFATGRHEVIHALREAGLFTDKEWGTLEKAAGENGWLDRYNIHQRYAHLDDAGRLEEAIAEAFGEWGKGQLQVGGLTAFEKIQEFIEKLIAKIGEHLGITAASTSDMAKAIFEQIQQGEIKDRELADHDAFMRDVQDRIDANYAQRPPANDIDAFQREDIKTYAGARDAQIIERTVNENTIRGDADYWYNIAKREGHLNRLSQQPNSWEALKAHSQGGKTTLMVLPDGRRVVAKDGRIVAWETPAPPKASRKGPPEGTGPDEIKIRPPFMDGKPLSTSKAIYERYIRLIQKKHEADLARDYASVWDKERRAQTAEWKANETTVRQQVEQEIDQKPNVIIDQLLSQKAGNLKIDPTSVRKDMLELLPKDYTRRTNSISADDLAGYFGYPSGGAMVSHLAQLSQDRVASGLNAADFRAKLIKDETSRRMEAQFGFLERNILEEAKDRALTQNQVDILSAETMLIGWKRGLTMPMQYSDLVAGLRKTFMSETIGGIDSDAFLRDAGKAGGKAHDALVKGDYQEAFNQKQLQHNATLKAKWALAEEKAKAQVDKLAKSLGKMEPSRGKSVPVEPEYLAHAQDLLRRLGYNTRRSWANIQENILATGVPTLQDFVGMKLTESDGYRDIPLAEFLWNPKFSKPLSALTVQEFRDVKATLDALNKEGREEAKIYREGKAADVADVRGQMIDQIKGFPAREIKAGKAGEPGGLRKLHAGLSSLETLWQRLDGGDKNGVFHKYLLYPMAAAANEETALLRKFAEPYRALPKPDHLTRQYTSPLDPRFWKNINFTHENKLGLIQNAGNASNWDVTARGWGKDPAELWQWLVQNSTAAEWERAQQLGSTVFDQLIKLADAKRLQRYGSTIDKIPLQPFELEFPDGTKFSGRGWYHPLVDDPRWERPGKGRGSVFDDVNTHHIATSDGFARARTGAIYPVDLSFGQVPQLISQMIHDIAFRDVILDSQKFLRDGGFMNAMTQHVGEEWTKMLRPYLQRIAGQRGSSNAFGQWATAWSEALRQGAIFYNIAGNLATVQKHAPTAFFMSAADVGYGPFLSSYKKMLFSRPDGQPASGNPGSNFGAWQRWIREQSEEIQRRERNWGDSFGVAQKELYGEPTARDKMSQYGSRLIAKSDIASAGPAWLARYEMSLAEGDSIGLARDKADLTVRKAHGSTAITNQPEIVAQQHFAHGWFVSFYGFFGTVMQRRIETMYKMNEAYKLGMEGQIKAAAAKLPSIMWNVMHYYVLPTLIEEWVTSQTTENHEGWGEYLIKGAVRGAASGIPFLRDLAYGLTRGHEPSLGLASGPVDALFKVGRDMGQGTGALNRAHAGKTISDFLALVGGYGAGVIPRPAVNIGHHILDTANGLHPPQPKGFGDLYRLYETGQAQKKVQK